MGSPARTITYKTQWYLVSFYDKDWEVIPGTESICEGLYEVVERVKLWNDLREGRLLWSEVSTPGLIATEYISIEKFEEVKEVDHGEA